MSINYSFEWHTNWAAFIRALLHSILKQTKNEKFLETHDKFFCTLRINFLLHSHSQDIFFCQDNNSVQDVHIYLKVIIQFILMPIISIRA